MDLKEFKFPEVSKVDMAFPTFGTIPELLEEAVKRKFYNGNTEYNKLFSAIFFSGGKVKFKKGLDKEFVERAWAYCSSLMGSYTPKHEEKEAVCAMIMSEILEPELEK